MFKTDSNGRIVYLQTGETKHAPLWWHERGLSQTASGYGRKLTTSVMVRTESAGPWRRVYVCQFSNAGTAYVVIKGERFCVQGAAL